VGKLKPDHGLEDASNIDLAQATAIALAVDGLPLALEQVGAYIEENSCDLTEYLARYEKQHKTLLDYHSELEPEEQKTVMTTWSLSFKNIEEADPIASELLEFCAFLHPDAISKDVIITSASQLSSALASNATDIDKLNSAIRLLRRYSLLRSTPDLTILTIHRLVQTILKDRMDQEKQREWAERTVRAINLAFPDVEFNVWAVCEQVLPHAQVCVIHIGQWTMTSIEAARLLYVTGLYLYERGRSTEAEPLLQQGLRMRKQLLGDEHTAVAECLNSLAELYRTQGKYLQAMPLCEQALHIRERSLDEEHPDVGTSVNNLGRLYHHLGRFADAEVPYQRALNIRRRTLHTENSDVAWSLNDLGLLYDDQGRYTEAEPLYIEARDITERTLGKSHPTMANCLSNLASYYQNLGRYVEAKQSYQRALIIQEGLFGTKHPNLVFILGGFADLYNRQRNFKDAEPIYQRALKICEQSKPLYHRRTLDLLQSYANMLRLAKRNTKASEIEERIKEIRKEIAGEQQQ
jgi:tetratricopeptide (TPR) repeat protein